jgi:hypothetical protein
MKISNIKRKHTIKKVNKRKNFKKTQYGRGPCLSTGRSRYAVTPITTHEIIYTPEDINALKEKTRALIQIIEVMVSKIEKPNPQVGFAFDLTYIKVVSMIKKLADLKSHDAFKDQKDIKIEIITNLQNFNRRVHAISDLITERAKASEKPSASASASTRARVARAAKAKSSTKVTPFKTSDV